MRRPTATARGMVHRCLALVCALLTAALPGIASAARADGAPAERRSAIIIVVCDGDCDGDGQVSIAELVTGVNIAQGQLGVDACEALDVDGNGSVSIAELITAVSAALGGCGLLPEPLTLSDAALAPGEMLTLFHSSIAAGEAVEVTFQGAGRYRLTVRTELTEDGAAQIAVPPFVDTSSGRFGAGEVAVSIAGVPGAAPFFIDALPEVGGPPGDITSAVLAGGLDNIGGALAGLAALRTETGIEDPQLALTLFDQADLIAQIADEIDGSGRLTLGTGTGSVVMDGETLAVLDRLVAAPFLGYARQHPLAGALGRTADLPDREELADLLDRVKRQGIAGMQTLGSYVSVLSGTVALIAVVIPPLEPLAGVAAATAVASTAVVTLGSVGVSIIANLGIDAIRGEEPDLYRAARDTDAILANGARSIALTVAGAIEWAGQTAAGIASLVNDSRDGVTNVRDLTCASQQGGSLRWGQVNTRRSFCDATQYLEPTATATVRPPATSTPTTRPPATPTRTTIRSATPVRTPTATPSRTATAAAHTATPRPTATVTRPPATATRTAVPTHTSTVLRTATRTRTPTRTATPTRTPSAGTFTVLFYQNVNGATGTGAAGAQIKLSGAADFPTIGWTAAVGSAQQVTVGLNGGDLLYGIAATGDGAPVPIDGPVHYGDYGIPDTVPIFGGAAPPLQAGGEYVAIVVPFVFQGGTASIVFRVGR